MLFLGVKRKQGFASIYGIFLLFVCLSFIAYKTKELQVQTQKTDPITYAEIYGIETLKQRFEAGQYDDYECRYEGYHIMIKMVDKNEFTLSISKDNLSFSSKITFKKDEKSILLYEYL